MTVTDRPMPAKLADYQSLVQLAAGVNIALFALPSLRQPEIEREARAWKSVIAWAAGAGGTISRRVRIGSMIFEAELTRLEEGVRAVKPLCLYAAGLATAYLWWMSAHPDRLPDDWTYLALLASSLPAALFAWLNLRARARLSASRAIREAFERELALGAGR